MEGAHEPIDRPTRHRRRWRPWRRRDPSRRPLENEVPGAWKWALAAGQAPSLFTAREPGAGLGRGLWRGAWRRRCRLQGRQLIQDAANGLDFFRVGGEIA